MHHIILLIFTLAITASSEDTGVTVPWKYGAIDYSDLAGEAEQHRHDILNFLNQTYVQEKYKLMYKYLLEELSESTRRIVYGRNTSIAVVPWQFLLRKNTHGICGGSVITDLWLLTAAHCLLGTQSSELSVRLGSSWKTHGGEMYDVKEYYIHPRYDTKTKINDVGLITLYSPLHFSESVLPIRLVARQAKLLADSPVIVSGWGSIREGGPSATYLQSSIIKTIAMKFCKQSGLDPASIDPSSMFCAGSFTQPSADACQGDSGGPIVNNGILIGVVSWGKGCARGNFPGVYARLSYPDIWDWVHSYIEKPALNETMFDLITEPEHVG